MHWQELGTFEIINDWVVSPPIFGEMFRVTHLSVPAGTDYVKAVMAQGFFDHDNLVNIFSPQRLTVRNEREIFLLPEIKGLERRLLFKRLDKIDVVRWIVKVEFNMFFVNPNKKITTRAAPIENITISTTKFSVIPENTNGNRQSYLILNAGNTNIYFKYLELGQKIDTANIGTTAGTYDFTLTPDEKYIDSQSSQNGLIAIVTNAVSAKIRAIEYLAI